MQFDRYLHPSNHFKVVSTLLSGSYDVTTSENVKSTLKQRYVRQRWDLQHYTASNQRYQRCLFQRDTNNIRQFQKIVFIFNVEFQNVVQCRDNVVIMTICKKLKNESRIKRKIIFLSFE